jgi:hypothetical protein
MKEKDEITSYCQKDVDIALLFAVEECGKKTLLF